MAVMTYKELKKHDLDHGEKWFGYVENFFYFNETLLILINFECQNEQHAYYVKEMYALQEKDGELVVKSLEHEFSFKSVSNDIPDHILFSDSLEGMVEYAKTAPLLCPVNDGKPTFGYKLLRTYPYGDFGLAFLEIPPNAKRTNPYFGRKCRADKAKVKAIWKLDKNGNLTEKVNCGYSPIHYNFIDYHVGENVYSEYYDDSRLAECTNGIHFYSTIDEVLELHQQLFRDEEY